MDYPNGIMGIMQSEMGERDDMDEAAESNPLELPKGYWTLKAEYTDFAFIGTPVEGLPGEGIGLDVKPLPDGRRRTLLIATPYFRPNGKGIELAVNERFDGGYHISDEGKSLDYIQLTGVPPNEESREAVSMAISNHAASLEESMIYVECDTDSLANSLERVARASRAVSELVRQLL